MSNVDVVNRVYAGFAAGDINAVVATFADDIEWTEAAGYPYAGTFAGAEDGAAGADAASGLSSARGYRGVVGHWAMG